MEVDTRGMRFNIHRLLVIILQFKHFKHTISERKQRLLTSYTSAVTNSDVWKQNNLKRNDGLEIVQPNTYAACSYSQK